MSFGEREVADILRRKLEELGFEVYEDDVAGIVEIMEGIRLATQAG